MFCKPVSPLSPSLQKPMSALKIHLLCPVCVCVCVCVFVFVCSPGKHQGGLLP